RETRSAAQATRRWAWAHFRLLWLPPLLRRESGRHVSPGRHLRRQNSKGRQARRPAGRAADQVRAGDQPQDRQGPRVDDSSLSAGSGGPGDRVVERRAFIGLLTGSFLAAPFAAPAQQDRLYRVGVVHQGGGSYEQALKGLR